MKNNITKLLLSTALLSVSMPAVTEDIDLFLKQAPSNAASAPNLLIVFDNQANFSANVADQVCRISATGQVSTLSSGLVHNPTNPLVPEYIDNSNDTELNGTAAAVEQCGLYAVIQGLDVNDGVKVNLGVMMFNSNSMLSLNPATGKLERNCVGKDGGCLVYPIVPMTATNQTTMLNWIKNWTSSSGASAGDTVSSSKKHNIKGPASAASGASMQESWAYFKGKTGISGRDYLSSVPESLCGKEYVVFIGNAYRNNNAPGDSTGDAGPKNALAGMNSVAGMNASPAADPSRLAVYSETLTTSCGTNSLESSENKGVYALNWARYLLDQGIRTYSIGILGPTCNGEYAAHLTKMGQTKVGGGKYFPTRSFQDLKAAMNEILAEAQSVNSVFSAVSLPVSVNTQGTYLNQVYIGMFRPDAQVKPRWTGNLKQYKLGKVGNDIQLQDANSRDAINPGTGFITECARSFWTPTAVDDYWTDIDPAKGSCKVIANSFWSNSPDGNIVEKGAQAFKLRNISTTSTATTRTVKTCSSDFATCSTTAALTSFDSANASISQESLDKTTGATNRNTLINWARGLNVADEELKGTGVMRPSSHGDVVHSRPVAINYGTDKEPSIVVYYGANDGMLRAVNGNRGCVVDAETSVCPPDATVGTITSASKTFTAGDELWSFMPPEFYSSIKRIYDNTPLLSLAGDTSNGELPKAYGFDGPLTALQGTVDGTAKSMIYGAMRRGGRALYAFDVTEPGAPTLKWKKGCPENFPASGTVSDSGCSTGFGNIGQTWSSAKKIYAPGYGSGSSPMLIMGGGYDVCEDTDNGTVNHSCTTTTKGNRIYIMDAGNGNALKVFETKRSVIGDVTIVADESGMATYAYAADMGGNIYRISGVNANTPIASTAPSAWTITRIASLGCDTAPGTCNANRKFMHAPGVVYDNGQYILLVGSGDREKPLNNYAASYGVTNYFFMVKDNPSSTTWLSSENTNCSADIICMNSLLAIAATGGDPSPESLEAKKGWYLGLAAHEQVVTSTVTIFGTTTFSSHQPATAESQQGVCGSNLGTTLVYNIRYTNASSANGNNLRYEAVAGNGLPPSPVAGQVTLDSGETVPFCIGCSGDSPLQGKYKEKPNTGTGSPYKSRVYWYIQK